MKFDLFTISFSLAPCTFYVLAISWLAEKTFLWYFMVANDKNFFWAILVVSFRKDVFVFWYSDKITNFEFGVFFVRIFIVFIHPLWYPSYSGSLLILNALSFKNLWYQVLRFTISHIMLKTSFIKFIFANKICISCLHKVFNSLLVFCEWNKKTISKTRLF